MTLRTATFLLPEAKAATQLTQTMVNSPATRNDKGRARALARYFTLSVTTKSKEANEQIGEDKHLHARYGVVAESQRRASCLCAWQIARRTTPPLFFTCKQSTQLQSANDHMNGYINLIGIYSPMPNHNFKPAISCMIHCAGETKPSRRPNHNI